MEPSELSEVANVDNSTPELPAPRETDAGEKAGDAGIIEEHQNAPIPEAFREKPHDPFHGPNDPVSGKGMDMPLPRKPLGGARKK